MTPVPPVLSAWAAVRSSTWGLLHLGSVHGPLLSCPPEGFHLFLGFAVWNSTTAVQVSGGAPSSALSEGSCPCCCATQQPTQPPSHVLSAGPSRTPWPTPPRASAGRT